MHDNRRYVKYGAETRRELVPPVSPRVARGVRTDGSGYSPDMMDPRPTGIVVGLIGAVVLVVSALADPLGIGEGHTFGWLQILGVILGALILLLGLAIAAKRVPVPGRRRTVVTSGPENTTTIVEDPAPPPGTP
jgi:hypothetical protein